MSSNIKVGKYAIALSNQDKIFFLKSKITKGDLVEYYTEIAPIMLPYMKDRPISMQRFPHGLLDKGFYQKDASDYFPGWITTKAIKKQEGGTVDYVVVNNAATLVYLANQACITPHLWLSRTDKLHAPDRMIFDLDPSGKANFEDVQWAAQTIRQFLHDELSFSVFIMTTGSRGAHVVIPLKRLRDFEYVREFAYDVARVLVCRYPERLTIDMSKAKRGNRIFIDWLRNGFGATGVSPYAVRAIEGAPVAMPLSWEDFAKIKSSQEYTIKNAVAHVKRHGDEWRGFSQHATALTKARAILDKIIKKELL